MAITVIGRGGIGNYTFWARESVWGNAAVAMPLTAVATHQPFNATIKIPVPNIGYKDTEVYLADALVPGIVYTENISPVDVSYETFYRDPFFMLTMFSNKTVTGAATWGAGNTGTITGDFTVETYKDSVMIQVHEDDEAASEDLDYTYLGGKINQYSWYAEPGKLLKERATIKMMNAVPQVRAYSADADFDDGVWGDWDQDGPFHSKKCSLEWNGSALPDFAIKNWEFIVRPEINMLPLNSQYYVEIEHPGTIKAEIKVNGYMRGNTLKAQYLTVHSSKLKQTMEAIYNDAGGTEERKLQSTNVYLSKLNYEGVPEPGKIMEVEAIFLTGAAGAVSFSGKYESHVDPYTSPKRINTVNR